MTSEYIKRSVFVSSLIFVFVFGLFLPSEVKASGLASASATLSNSRLSFRAQPTAGTTGSSAITISSSGQPDSNTNHLFPSDDVCFTDAGIEGCIGNRLYSVSSISDSTHFNLTDTLTNDVSTSGYAVSTQSRSLVLAFRTIAEIPVGGDLYITIPMADNAKGNDGIPDAGSSTGINGFDLNGLASGGVTVTGCTDVNWGAASITPGSGTTDHTIQVTRSSSVCPADTTITITITIDGLVNPSPVTSGHTQGTADNYRITVLTRDAGDITLDSGSPAVTPVEGVFVSTTINQSLSFAIYGVASTSGTLCGVSRSGSSLTTTAMAIPWGTIATPDVFFDAVQRLVISTNSTNGYVITVEENDQMGQNGATCTGAGNEGSIPPCIKDTSCSGTACTTTQARDWTSAVGYPGLGMTLENTNGGNDAAWTYTDDGADCSGGTYCARPLPDQEQGISKVAIMQNSAPVSQSSAFVCYRISVGGTQPAGYYYNKVKYTATATF